MDAKKQCQDFESLAKVHPSQRESIHSKMPPVLKQWLKGSSLTFVCCQVYFCPLLHGLLNVSLSPISVVFVVFGPLLASFYFLIMMVERSSFNCSRFMEIRHVIVLSLLHVTWNLFCRFFYIVHADKGLVVRSCRVLNRL